MPLIVVRLHPAGGAAVSGAAFSAYLNGLTVKVFDLATTAPEAQVGTDAVHLPLPDATHPDLPDPGSRIVQHFAVTLLPTGPVLALQSVATAVFVDAPPHPPAGRPEHGTRDLRIEISRGGAIIHRRLYFNVPQAPGPLPADPGLFPGLEPTALYLALPAKGTEVQPADAYVELSADGSAPPYDVLLNAVARVLGDDPGGPLALAALTTPQARHVAREIVWNQKFRPLPGPDGAGLARLYTAPASSDTDSARGQFEARQTAYYATGDADAERLAGYVVALAAAVDAEARSTAATRAALTFPVLPGQSATGARYRRARALLTGLPAAARCTVPARYFYALGAALPLTFDSEQRFQAAVLADDQRLRTALTAARDTGVIKETPPPAPANLPAGTPPVADAPPVGIAQAVRRLRALGDTGGSPPPLPATGAVLTLFQAWLAVSADDIDSAFWDGVVAGFPAGHLELVLCALTRAYTDPADGIRLSAKIRAALAVADAPAVAATDTHQWEQLLRGDPTFPADLPDWTRPGSDEERVQAFIGEVRKFFAIAVTVPPSTVPGPAAPPLIRTPAGDPLNRFASAYAVRAGAPFGFGAAWVRAHRDGAVDDVAAALFPGDAVARQWLDGLVTTIDELVRLAAVVPQPLRFSVAEALFARGFTSRAQVAARSPQEFEDTLTGTVAFEFADRIRTGAGGGPATPSGAPAGGFVPVNPDGCLVDCVPPEHLSPLGPVAYLQALLALSVDAGCADPEPGSGRTLGELVATRRGPLGGLHVTGANLGTPLPLLDLVNECLEKLAGTPGTATGAVHDTNPDAVAGHALAGGAPPAPGAFRHDPATLFAALPEHSTPAVPGAAPGPAAYRALSTDFSHPLLPYAQALDVNRRYLGALGTSRYDVMRRFRRDITELVLDPDAEPAAFRRHVWRYPVRLELACEYLGISTEEYATLYAADLALKGRTGTPVWRLYGFAGPKDGDRRWTDVAVRVPEFLARTGLDWCEFTDLWRSGIVPFGRRCAGDRSGSDRSGPGGADDRPAGFEACEPCHLDEYVIDLADTADGLRRLAVVTRLWRTLRRSGRPALGFTELADVCAVLGLFDAQGSVNPDFVRQLAALEMLREEFGLPLRGPTPPPEGATGADRTALLALWAAPGAAGRPWAVQALLKQVAHHARRRHGCPPRPPEFLKLLAETLDPLSGALGFDPARPADTWHARPTHTLRLAELLAKLYAGDLGVGELRYLFSADDHLQGDDPFPLQPPNEALDDPLGLPDDDSEHSLWELRRALLDVTVGEDGDGDGDAGADGDGDEAWTWHRIDAALRVELGYAPAAGTDPLHRLGARFFPGVLDRAGIPVPEADRRWRAALPGSPPAMWNTPPDGPFRHAAGDLTMALPVTTEAVIHKLARIRQLTPAEQAAVRDLTAGPAADLAPFGFLFEDLDEALRRLAEEPDEAARFGYFRRAVARCLARCHVIARHLDTHVAALTGQAPEPDAALARLLLAHLHGDENRATTPWEADSGATPVLSWPARPTGGAFAALLALTGTGLLGEYRADADGGPVRRPVRWRELRGPLRMFGPPQNAANAPLPGLVPDLATTVTVGQGRFVAVRNGFALTDPTGQPLGGAQGYTVCWSGALLVDRPGSYTFHAGGPVPDGELPDPAQAEGRHWRVTLRRGRRSWVLLAHRRPGESAAPQHRAALALRHGAYDIEIELVQPQPDFDDPDDIVATTAGFQLSYQGPDSGGHPVAVPRSRLYRTTQQPLRLDDGIDGLTPAERAALTGRYTGSLRDIRRTYQRAFKALLFARRLGLSATPAADDGQSETGYLLANPGLFAGAAHHRSGSGFAVHLAGFDPDLLPLHDTYHPPTPAEDGRSAPSRQRTQALGDWWERLYDYTVMRRRTRRAPERPAWLLFHESAEGHPDLAADLLRHLGVDLQHTALVRRYDPGTELTAADLTDEQWPVRVWHADLALRGVLARFLPADIRTARPDLWAALAPGSPPDGTGGNADLTRFVADGRLENGPPRRYQDLADLNDCLREQGRAALLAYLTTLDRVSLPWGGAARRPGDLSALLLLDVEAGPSERADRIGDAISAVQTLVGRARLGVEKPALVLSDAFLRLWDSRFSSYRLWEACERRRLYGENRIDLDELAKAQRTEAFRYFEAELRRTTMTAPAPGGLEYWTPTPLPRHPGLKLLQVRDPAVLHPVDPAHHGFDLSAAPDRDARPSWLAATRHAPVPVQAPGPGRAAATAAQPVRLPWWIRSAVRLGIPFLRVAASGEPPAAAMAGTPPRPAPAACCARCGGRHEALVDEYYFWLADSRWFAAQTQDAGWQWHDDNARPGLLAWRSGAQAVLAWTRVHNGEPGPVRHSAEAVRLGGPGELLFGGRADDSLTFAVQGGETPAGHPATPPPGFRYDLATDEAVLLPEIPELRATPPVPPPVPPPAGPPGGPPHPGALPAYPYFAYHAPGAPLFPESAYAPAISVAAALRAHCRPEAALRWYELAHDPLHSDSSWLRCGQDHHAPGTCCTGSTTTDPGELRRRSVLLHYLETLLDRGDALMRGRPTREAAAQARVVYETMAALLGRPPRTVLEAGGPAEPATVADFQAHPPRPNPRLLRLYDETADRLALIRGRLDAQRLRAGRRRTDLPRLGAFTGPTGGALTDGAFTDGWTEPPPRCPDDEWCLPQSPYRFAFLLPKAVELATEVRSLGSLVLAAHERGDAEYLAALRADQERRLLALTVQVRQAQWRDADWQVQALGKTKQVAQTNRRYYAGLVEAGLVAGENDYLSLTGQAVGDYGTSIPLEATGQAMSFVPDIWLGVAGLGPLNANQLPLGTKLAGVFGTAARIANTLGQIAATTSGERLTQAGWERREADWRHQVEVLDIDIDQIERQILAAERRRDAALRELDNQQRLVENADRIRDFERDKLTGHALFLRLQQETAALHHGMYELALRSAHQAQRAFNFERGHTAGDFLAEPLWDSLHEGLLAGERLELALRRMEHTFLDLNAREYELTKHISLRLAFPLQYLTLLATGSCEIELAEWLFDLDHPGHYLRRIKNVSLSVPCVVGPYTGVHARLTLLSSTTRVSPRLTRPAPACCDDPDGCRACRPLGDAHPGGYELLPEDPRAVQEYAAREAIATSSGQTDAGMFEVNFRDERYLPFESHGAVSRWRLELPPENNQFDISTVSDVILHLAYTAREGGDGLRRAATGQARRRLPGDGLCLIDVARDLPDAWYAIQQPAGGGARRFPLRLSRGTFPFLRGGHELEITALAFMIEAACATPGRHHTLRFEPSRPDGGGGESEHGRSEHGEFEHGESGHDEFKHGESGHDEFKHGEFERVEFEEVRCVAGAEWPGMFHGVLDELDGGVVPADREALLGTVQLPPELGPVSRLWLVCGYRTCQA